MERGKHRFLLVACQESYVYLLLPCAGVMGDLEQLVAVRVASSSLHIAIACVRVREFAISSLAMHASLLHDDNWTLQFDVLRPTGNLEAISLFSMHSRVGTENTELACRVINDHSEVHLCSKACVQLDKESIHRFSGGRVLLSPLLLQVKTTSESMQDW